MQYALKEFNLLGLNFIKENHLGTLVWRFSNDFLKEIPNYLKSYLLRNHMQKIDDFEE